MKMIRTLLLIALTTAGHHLFGQACTNEVIYFQETFGSGTGRQSLPAGRTNYNYNGSSSLNDGDYTLYNSSQAKPEWHNGADHTGDVNGRMMVANASYTPGEFYRDTVHGLSAAVTYSVYLYAMNVNTPGTCAPNPILPRLQLIVESYNSDGSFTELASVASDYLPQTATPTWVRIAGFVNLPAGVTAVRYRVINHSTGGCGNDLAIDDVTFAQCSLMSLPVSGLELKAENTGKAVELNWSTQQEKDTDKFIVEKSADGRNWKPFDAVPAAGQSLTTKVYSAVDAQPYAGTGYYRIAARDTDGKLSYSNTVLVKSSPASGAVKFSAFPNPFIGSVGVEMTASGNSQATIRLFDINGKLQKTMNWTLRQGSNLTTLSGLDGLPAGLYFLDITDREGKLLFKTKLLKK